MNFAPVTVLNCPQQSVMAAYPCLQSNGSVLYVLQPQPLPFYTKPAAPVAHVPHGCLQSEYNHSGNYYLPGTVGTSATHTIHQAVLGASNTVGINNTNNSNNNTNNAMNMNKRSSTPVNVGTVCRHFLSGRCNRRKCRFLHQVTDPSVTGSSSDAHMLLDLTAVSEQQQQQQQLQTGSSQRGGGGGGSSSIGPQGDECESANVSESDGVLLNHPPMSPLKLYNDSIFQYKALSATAAAGDDTSDNNSSVRTPALMPESLWFDC